LAVKGPELFSKYVGESEKALREMFRKAREASPSIIFFDEIDAMAARRAEAGEGGSGATDRVLSQLLTEMDGVETLGSRVIVAAATNRPDMLDPALLRPGRFDRILYVAPPDHAARKEILRIALRKTPHSLTSEQEDALAAGTENFSGAEMAALCREAAMIALRADADAAEVTFEQLREAAGRCRPRISADMLRFYADFQRQTRLQSI
jgi:AAA family ATPase